MWWIITDIQIHITQWISCYCSYQEIHFCRGKQHYIRTWLRIITSKSFPHILYIENLGYQHDYSHFEFLYLPWMMDKKTTHYLHVLSWYHVYKKIKRDLDWRDSCQTYEHVIVEEFSPFSWLFTMGFHFWSETGDMPVTIK